jgi:hypothetical protein
LQIAFLTLFLGLINGTQTVTLEAGTGVAAIELLLDGRAVARISGAPWTAKLDFGAGLLPHHLEARGFAADGSEIGRAEQWVNLPRPPAEVQIVLEGTPGSRKRTARLVWDHLTGEPPSAVALSLDGAPLALDAQARAPIEIPQAGSAHVLSAELRFVGGAQVRKDVVLTGDWDGDVATELTAVPVRTARAGEKLSLDDLQGRFSAGGQPLRAAAVEQEPAEVYVVRAPGAEDALLGKVMNLRGGANQYGRFSPDRRIRFHFVSPVARLYHNAGTPAEIFDISQGLTFQGYDMARLLLAIRNHLDGRPRLADAVAVAGLHALARQTPRAVVLIVARRDGASDASLFLPPTVRAYLSALGVPLFVWSFGKPAAGGQGWGEIHDVTAPWGLREAYERLEKEVLGQQIVWLQGRHLPQSIALASPTAGSAAAAANRLELVAAVPPP